MIQQMSRLSKFLCFSTQSAQESEREADDEADTGSEDSATEDHVAEEGEEEQEEEEEDDILMPMQLPPKPRIRCVIESSKLSPTGALERRGPKLRSRYKSVCCFGLFQSGTPYGNESCP